MVPAKLSGYGKNWDWLRSAKGDIPCAMGTCTCPYFCPFTKRIINSKLYSCFLQDLPYKNKAPRWSRTNYEYISYPCCEMTQAVFRRLDLLTSNSVPKQSACARQKVYPADLHSRHQHTDRHGSNKNLLPEPTSTGIVFFNIQSISPGCRERR